ncbi:MAG: hypothetical protein JNK61_07430 [Bacteroidia bacterium]|nr:hypothetical protein [Bacteroidia bacterium]
MYWPFFDFSNTVGQTLRFYQKYDTEIMWDGHRMEYRFGEGPWQVLGSFGMTAALNWYNIDSLIETNLPAWAGQVSNWQKVELYDLNAMAGKQSVQFRFVFNSDMVISNIGSFIDNFEIDEPKYNSVANQTLDLVTNLIFSYSAKKIKTEIKSVGYNPLYSCKLSVIVDNTVLVTDTVYFNPPILYGKVYWVTSMFNLTQGNHTICTHTFFPNGVSDSIAYDDIKCKTTFVYPMVNNIPSHLNIDSIANGFNTQRSPSNQTTDLPNTDKTIKVHPNPVSQFLYVNFTGKVPDVLQIFTTTGLLVKQENLNTQNHNFLSAP